MGRKTLFIVSLSVLAFTSGSAMAATSPTRVVQQFIEDHLRGRFAEARRFTLEGAQLSTSLFSSWLFGGKNAATADVFLSRKFSQVFKSKILGSTPSGDNQTRVTVIRTSPNLVHLYTWALAPARGATPYELIDAIDTYLSKVNFPVEESRMEFTLIRELDDWYIAAVHEEKFVQLQQQWLAAQPLSSTPLPALAANSPRLGNGTSPAPAATHSTDNRGRQMADAQFNATLQGFNQTYQAPATQQLEAEEEKPSFLGKLAQVIGLGGKKTPAISLTSANLEKTFKNIRDALALYASDNNGFIPGDIDISDWQSLRHIVNRYGKRPLPATEAEAGFTFVDYSTTSGYEDYILLLELHDAQNGLKRIEVTPYGLERAG